MLSGWCWRTGQHTRSWGPWKSRRHRGSRPDEGRPTSDVAAAGAQVHAGSDPTPISAVSHEFAISTNESPPEIRPMARCKGHARSSRRTSWRRSYQCCSICRASADRTL